MKKRIHLDFETRSIVDLRTRGDQVYAQHPSTIPLMLSWIDGDFETVFDFMQGELWQQSYPNRQLDHPLLNSYIPQIHPIIEAAINDPDVVFVAHNARFEQSIWYWICHKRWGWPMITRWTCTAARARYWGLRASLDGAGRDLEIENLKDATGGMEFIKEFCTPRKYKGAKKNGIIVQHWKEPAEDPSGWERGKHYCLVDSKAERDIDRILPDLPPFEQAVWELDFAINTTGIPIDVENVEKATHFSDYYNQLALMEFNAVTGYNPTQRDRVLEYLNEREEISGSLWDLRSKTLQRMTMDSFPEELRRIIQIRVDAARASVKKLEAMKNAVSTDYRARGCFLYHGAHTGRWSAKRLQPHNFVRGSNTATRTVFRYLESPCWGQGLSNGLPAWVSDADLLFPAPLKSLSQSMRGFIKAPTGYKIVSGDYSQIEARVLAWLAICEQLLADYSRGVDVYVRFAADHMYRDEFHSYFGGDGKVLPSMAGRRQKAKSAVLGCGFGLGPDGFQLYCDNQDVIISFQEAEDTVKAYRTAYPEIASWQNGLWRRMNWCATTAVEKEGEKIYLHGTNVTFHVHRLDSERWWLLITLPSGRHIAYYRPKIDSVDQWGRPILTYRQEVHGTTRRTDTWGGKITENVVQAIARDICAYAAHQAWQQGYEVFMLVHDEIVTLVKDDDTIRGKDHLHQLMLNVPACYNGLPLGAETKEMIRYSK